MTKFKLEYIWLDGYTPTPNLRGKTQIKEFDSFPALEQLPLWGFDGSSTMQAEGHNSDRVLKPVAIYPDAARTNSALVMCEVMMPDGKTPHPSNKRATILDDEGAWFGYEQEYFFYKDGRPLGFPSSGYPAPQGPYYTGVGYKNVGDIADILVADAGVIGSLRRGIAAGGEAERTAVLVEEIFLLIAEPGALVVENGGTLVRGVRGLAVGHHDFAHHQRAIGARGVRIDGDRLEHAIRIMALGLHGRASVEAPQRKLFERRK